MGIQRDFGFLFLQGMFRDGVSEYRYPWGLWVGGAITSLHTYVRMGREVLPMTPRWSKIVEGMFCVLPIWCIMCLGSHGVRRSMQEAWSGCWRGKKVGVVGPFHLTKRERCDVGGFWGGAVPIAMQVSAHDEDILWERLG